MDVAGPPNRVGRSAAEDLSGRVFWSEAGARSRCAGVPRAKSRGVAQRRGKNSATMVSCGPATSIGPTPKQGFGPATHRSGPQHAGSIASAEEALCKVQSRSVRLRSQRDREAACQTSMPRPIAVSYPPHVMGKLACARDAKRCVLRRGVAIRYFDSAPIAFSCASSERI